MHEFSFSLYVRGWADLWLVLFFTFNVARWSSGLRRWIKVPILPRAWVQTPLSSFFVFCLLLILFFFYFYTKKKGYGLGLNHCTTSGLTGSSVRAQLARWLREGGSPNGEAIHRIMRRMFPSHTRFHDADAAGSRVRRGGSTPLASSEWPLALLLVELSEKCVTSDALVTSDGESKRTVSSHAPLLNTVTPPSSTMEESVIVYILEHCVFPKESWQSSLFLLNRWRKLHLARTGNGTLETSSELFPPFSSLISVAHMMRNLSNNKAGWVDVMQLYFSATRETSKVLPKSSPNSETLLNEENVFEKRTSPESKSNKRHVLRWMRHVTLTSLLNAGKWIDSLHFYRHMLYQREIPSHICTGHLIQKLGDVNCWTEAARLFELNLKILKAHQDEICGSRKSFYAKSHNASSREKMGNEWGTMFSMALDVVSRVCHQPDVALQMFNAACAMNADGSLFRWDGNFLSAVQFLPSARDRLDVLSRAKKLGQLDHFKLIRGLVHHGKWSEAIAVFADGMERKSLTRRDIGRCRLNILHASSAMNVQTVLQQLQTLCGRPSSSLRLNDGEAECVLSKISSSKLTSSPYWRFGLQILNANYSVFMNRELKSEKGITTSGGEEERRPTKRMISLFLRNEMPWQVALRLFHISSSAQSDAFVPNTTSTTSSEALLVNRVMEILHAQRQKSELKRLLSRAMELSRLSPSSGMLEFLPTEFLVPSADRVALVVDNKVLYHYLQTTTDWQRALCIVELVEQQRGGGFLRGLPASVHCETIRLICRFSPPANAWLLALRHLQRTLDASDSSLHASTIHEDKQTAQQVRNAPMKETENPAMREAVYSVMYETLLSLLEAPEVRSANDSTESVSLRLAQEAVTQCGGRIPTHMLLPNQIDRLLPRLGSATSLERIPNATERMRVAFRLVRSVLASLREVECVRKENSSYTATGDMHNEDQDSILEGVRLNKTPPVDAVMMHELQKLTCRVAEYYEAKHKLLRKNVTSPTKGAGLLWQTSLELLTHQCQLCGVDTVSPAALKLLYRTCAAAGGEWSAALQATQFLLYQEKNNQHQCEHQQQANKQGFSRRYEKRERHFQMGRAKVGEEHCALYCSLFGWEKGLALWCQHSPQQMLHEVTNYPAGLEYVLRNAPEI